MVEKNDSVGRAGAAYEHADSPEHHVEIEGEALMLQIEQVVPDSRRE
jgi:hypothetical protein